MDLCAGDGLHHLRPDKPGQALDYVTGGLILAFTIPFVLGNVVMVWFRNYSPIKSKSVPLTVLSSLGGLIWVAATLVVNDHFGRKEHTIWTVCTLWTFWLQASFGFALWLNCFILRLLNLYFMLILKRGAIKCVVVALLMLLSPIIIFSIFASSYGASRFRLDAYGDHNSQINGSRSKDGDCTIRTGWPIGLLILLPLYFLVFIGLAISLRNIRPLYNEFRLIRNGGILSFSLFLLSLVTFQTKVYREVTGRCFLAVAVSGAVFYYFWARNWEVVYNALFNKEQYLAAFREKLNSFSSTSHSSSLETLLFDARDEVACLQAEVEELEQALAKLQEQYQKEERQVPSFVGESEGLE